MRRRYIAVKIELEDDELSECGKLSKGDVWGAVWRSFLQLYGEYGASQADLSLVEYNPDENYAVFRCSHKALETVRTAISAVTEVRGRKAAFHIIYVSGTLKALRKRIGKVNYNSRN